MAAVKYTVNIVVFKSDTKPDDSDLGFIQAMKECLKWLETHPVNNIVDLSAHFDGDYWQWSISLYYNPV